MKKKIGILIAGFFLFVAAYAGIFMSDVEHPKYEILSTDKNIETRLYQSMTIAQVVVNGERSDAIRKGFKIIADYIFGNNQNNTEIAMTAPVQQQGSKDFWKVSFVMPSKYSLDTLPEPNNKKITLKTVNQKKFVAIVFSGTGSDSNIQKNTTKIQTYIKDNNLKTKDEFKYAFYNPPWTLPFLRRNEIMVEIAN